MEDIRTRRDDGESGFDLFEHSKAYDGERSRAERTKSDLTVRRWHYPILDPGDDAELIRLAREGDERAKDELAKSFHRLALSIASQYHGAAFEDLLAAALLGLSEAIVRFNPQRNNGLRAYAEHWMRKYARLEAMRWRRRGQGGETRADRYVYHNRVATAEQVATKVGCSIAGARDAIESADAYWHGHDRYDTWENNYDADDNSLGSHPAASEVKQLYAFFSKYQLSPQLRLHEAASRTIDALVVDAHKRTERRLKAIGRQAYALEIASKNRTAIVPLFARTPMTYCIPINTAATASDSKEWRSDQDKLAAAATVQPMVWQERNIWGRWVVVDLRPKSDRVLLFRPRTYEGKTPSHPGLANYENDAAIAAL